MADPVNPFPVTIEHGADESRTCTEATNPKGEESPRPEASLRFGGGICDCQGMYQPASYDYAAMTDYQPSYYNCQGANQGYLQWQDCGNVVLPLSQCQCQTYAQPSQECGCCTQNSTHYMEYKGFQHSPKPNPVYVSTGCDAYSMSSRHAIRSGSSFGSISPAAKCPPKRSGSKCGFAGVKGSFERMRRRKQKQTQCCCQPIPPMRVLSVERCGAQPRRMNPPDRSCRVRKHTPVARTCEVRQHALSHVHGTCHPPPKRPAPPPCGRSSSRHRSRSCRGKSRASSVCSNPSDLMQRNRYGNSCLKAPVARTTSCYSGHCCGNSGYAQPRSRSPSCQTGYKRSCRKAPTCSEDPVLSFRPRSRSPSCQKQSGMNKRLCRKPPPCSNETLMEEPVKSYRFSCPENRTITLCPHCQKTMRQRCSSANKRCTSGATRKCYSKGRPLAKVPEVPSNRCIYRTLSRNLARPKLPPYKAKYELILCCKEPRCQGGGNEHHHHYLEGTAASAMKRVQKHVGGSSVSPTRMSSQRSNYSSGPSTGRYSNPRSSSTSHAPGHAYQSRNRATSEHQKCRTPAPSPAQRRHHSEHMTSTLGRDPRLALTPGRDSPTAPPMKRDSRLSSKSERDTPLTSSSGRDPRMHSMLGRDPRLPSTSGRDAASRKPYSLPQMSPQTAPPMAPQMSPQMAPPMAPQMAPQMASQMVSPVAPPLASSPEFRTSPGDDVPSSSKQGHRSHKERSHRKEREKDQQQSHQEPYSSPKSELKGKELAPGHFANPNPKGNPVTPEQQPQRQANYLGANINPYYRGNFLNTRSPLEPLTNPSVRPQGLNEHRRERPSSMLMVPPKWTGLGQLHSWVFGEPYVQQPSRRGSAWSWRQIFGLSKKRSQPRPQETDQ